MSIISFFCFLSLFTCIFSISPLSLPTKEPTIFAASLAMDTINEFHLSSGVRCRPNRFWRQETSSRVRQMWLNRYMELISKYSLWNSLKKTLGTFAYPIFTKSWLLSPNVMSLRHPINTGWLTLLTIQYTNFLAITSQWEVHKINLSLDWHKIANRTLVLRIELTAD